MFRYELKKVFSRRSSRIALILLLALLGVTCYFAMNVSYVNETGDTEKGFSAISRLKAAQKEWAGYLDEDAIRRVIAENKRIRESSLARSQNPGEQEIAYSQGQGIMEIRSLLNSAYAEGFREYDYYRADSLSESDAPNFYANRITLLTKWLTEEAGDQFSEKEKAYLIEQYQSLPTPFYYDYMKGWSQLFEFAPTVVMITMLILGYLVAGIFSSEFSWKADAVFFSSRYGRDKAVAAKIKAGFCMVTLLYWIVILLYSLFVLLYLGSDGWKCPVQIDFGAWKCLYHITVWQKYLLILLGGYLGCLFISALSMLVSARTRSAVLAVMVPFVLIFIPSFLGNINSPAINKILGLLPDQLLQTGAALGYFNLYSLGGAIVGAVPILFGLYTVLTICLEPLIYQVYRHRQIT